MGRHRFLMPNRGGGVVPTYGPKLLSVSSPIAYWAMQETSGSVMSCSVNALQNGTVTGADLGQPGIGDGSTSWYFDGTNDFGRANSATFNAAFSGAAGTAGFWGKVAAESVWADGVERQALIIKVDNDNSLFMSKSLTADKIKYYYEAGGSAEQVTTANVAGAPAWFHMLMSWSTAGDFVKYYLNGVSLSADDEGLSPWVGDPGANYPMIGALGPAPNGVWQGWLAHMAIWDTALDPSVIAQLGVV